MKTIAFQKYILILSTSLLFLTIYGPRANAQALIGSATVTNNPCFGDTLGSIDLTVSGGTSPHFFTWSTGETTEDISNLGAGNYSVTITDNASASVFALPWNYINTGASRIVEISSSNTSINGSPIQVGDYIGAFYMDGGNLFCAGYAVWLPIPIQLVEVFADDSTTTVKEGFDESDNYFWKVWKATDGGLVFMSATYSSTYMNSFSLTGACAIVSLSGTYTPPTTTNSIVKSFPVFEPQALTIISLVSEYNGFEVSSFGGTDGFIEVEGSNGTSPYTYFWGSGITTNNLYNLPIGNYTLTVTDVMNCSMVDSFYLTSTTLFASDSATDVMCYGYCDGSIDISPTGGFPPYYYFWSDGSTSQDASNLCAGSYSVTITDSLTGPPVPLPWSYTMTNSSHNFLIPQNSVQINNYQPKPGDYIGVFYLNGTGLHCAGYQIYANAISAIAVWGDDNTTSIQDGFEVGDEVYWKLWNYVNGDTIDLVPTFSPLSQNQNQYVHNGLSVLSSLTNPTVYVAANQFTQNYTVSEPPAISIISDLSNYSGFGVSSIGASDGFIDLNISGGNPPYSFAWSNGSSTEDISSLPAGNYSITVSDATGCSQSKSYFISQPFIINSIVNDASCGNSCDGSIEVLVDGALSPYSFLWSNGNTVNNISGLCAGPYSLTLSDASVPALDTVLSFMVGGPTAIQISAQLSDYNGSGVSAPGASDGWIDISVSGGTPPYSFVWTNGETTEDVANLLAGNYSVTVYDSLSCSVSQSFLIEQTLYISATVIGESCFGLCDGAIQLTASGGIPPYSFSWSNGASLQSLANLCGGTYQLTVTDSIGATSIDTFLVSSPSEIIATAQLSDYSGYGVSNIGASDGWINLTISGGSSPYSFAWSMGSTSEDISNLPAGNYLLTITDANTCQQTFSYSLNPVPFNPALTISGMATDATCFGTCNGSIDVTVSGGNPWYTYLWNDGSTLEDRTNLCAGNYVVVVNDNQPNATAQAFNWSFYTSSGNHTIAIPFGTVLVNGAAPDVGDVIGVFYDSTGVLKCGGYFTYNGGTIVVAAMVNDALIPEKTGFDGGDILNWKLWRSADSITVNMTATYSATQINQGTFQSNGISAISTLIGSYTLQGTQQTTFANFTIAQPDSIALSAVVVNVDTINNLQGSVTLSPIGGISPYSFLWSTGDTSEDISLLDTGWYALTLTDANLCVVEEEFYVGIAPVPQILVSSNISQIYCNGYCEGSINLNVTGGVPPFSYQWSNGETVEPIYNLCPGFYYVTIYDTYNSLILDFEITEPDTLGITPTITNVDPLDPFSGAIDLIPEGGVVPYYFIWSNGVVETAIVDSLSIGNYEVTVLDANGCSFEEIFSLGYSYVPDSISINTIISNISCNGLGNGQIDVNVLGGISPYYYLWNNGDTIEDINNLVEGNYELSVMDALNGYQLMPWSYETTGTYMHVNGSVQIDSTGNDYGDFFGVFFLDGNELKCGGYANIDWNFGLLAFGDNPLTPDKDGFAQGDSIYYKLWRLSDGNIVDMDVLNFNPQFFQGTFSAGGYSWQTTYYGSYTPTPTYTTASFTILEPDPISISGIMSDYGGFGVSTWGASDGSIDVTVSGGTPPYTYFWTVGLTTEDLANIPAGQYELLVSDANGCDTVEIFELSSPPPPPIVVNGTIENATCFGTCDGSIAVTATGGIPPLNFAWSNGETTMVVDNLCAGMYWLTVSDVDSSLILSFEITQPTEILLNITAGALYPDPNDSTFMVIIVTGGILPYTYLWSTGSTHSSITSVVYGLYTCTVSDANGCQQVGSHFVDFVYTPDWPVIATANQHTIEIPAFANLLLNGVALSTYDFVGVFYDSVGTQKCGGYAVWQNQAVSFVAYGDDAGTSDLDGFLTGDEFAWKIWDASEDLVHDAVAVYLPGYPNQQHFAVSGSSGIDSLYTNSLSGTVSTTTKSNLDLGMVVVYEQTAQGYYAVKKGLVVNGNYKIDGLKTGNYLCYAIPQPGHDWGIPGYFPTQNNWQSANWVHVQANTTGIDITIDPVIPYATGTASISGIINVGDDASYNPAVFDNEWFPPSTKNNGDPARNIPILLFDSLQHPIDFRLTDAQGIFNYENLEYGTYFVKVEKAGLQSEHIEVILDANNPTSDNLSFLLNEGQVIGINPVDVKSNILLYPNPVHDKLNVVLPSDFGKIETLEIFSQLGTKQNSLFSSSKEKQNSLQVDLAGYVAGIYLLKVRSDKDVAVVKFIKQ
ncbi:MAG: T9SS type A sorting domain-containing protein [Bacteroidales bacterium]|nr:T9SS type A sorting domain-containing protein [Bacteroidales bacterium]MCF8457510.1 T9SS type A sorting domain-containing protein [Bacteroidales bacterium]